MGTDLEIVSYCLDFPSINNPNNIIILFPIYCRRISLRSEDKGKYLAKFQIHKSLLTGSKAMLRFSSPMGEIKYADEFDLNDNVDTISEMVITRLPVMPQIGKNDYLEIEILNNSIHMMTEKMWAKEIFAEEYNFWLKNVIERIDPNLEKLESWLEGKDSKDFEKAVAILLSLCGLRTVHVGEIYEIATVKLRREVHRKTSVGVDIMVLKPSQEDNEIFLCQCTTDWNYEEKLNDVLDISNEINSTIESHQIRIYPILITQVERSKISSSATHVETKGSK